MTTFENQHGFLTDADPERTYRRVEADLVLDNNDQPVLNYREWVAGTTENGERGEVFSRSWTVPLATWPGQVLARE